jgi:hypothetical protein
VPDYSEFPTTPTAWQEQALRDEGWTDVQPLAVEDPPPARRRVDLVALVFGSVFVILAITVMSGANLAVSVFGGGGLLCVVLIAAGVALLAGELRKARRREPPRS